MMAVWAAAALCAVAILALAWRLHPVGKSGPARPSWAAGEPDPYGYFPIPPAPAGDDPALHAACGHQVVYSLYDEVGVWHDRLLSLDVDGRRCHLALVTHQLIAGMGAEERWTYASSDVETVAVVGQPSIGSSVGREPRCTPPMKVGCGTAPVSLREPQPGPVPQGGAP